VAQRFQPCDKNPFILPRALQFAEKLGFVGATVEERPFRAAEAVEN
jgi:hypothetical protein